MGSSGYMKNMGHLTVQEMIDSDPENPIIDLALWSYEKIRKKVCLLNRETGQYFETALQPVLQNGVFMKIVGVGAGPDLLTKE